MIGAVVGIAPVLRLVVEVVDLLHLREIAAVAVAQVVEQRRGAGLLRAGDHEIHKRLGQEQLRKGQMDRRALDRERRRARHAIKGRTSPS